MIKIILIGMLVLVLLFVFPMAGFAEESIAESDGTVPETFVETAEPAETVPDEPAGENIQTQHNIFSRAWEYVSENKKEVITVVGDGAIVILSVFIKLRNDKKTKDIENDLKADKGNASGTFTTQSAVVKVVNEMVDGYKGMKKTYDKNQSLEDDRNRLIGAVMVQNTALLEILNTVYINNKNLPQGVKDLINLKYANCLKTLENDEILCSIVESVKEKIGSGEAIEVENEATEV